MELVNFALDDGDIIIRTDSGGKLAAATRGAVVAFEADSVDIAAHAGWSVTIVGYSRAVTDGEDIRHLEQVGLVPWAPGKRDHFIRISPEIVNGRRLAAPRPTGIGMRVLSERQLAVVLGALPDTPRVVAGGNFATPWRALSVLDGTIARYHLFALNAQPGMPDREGVTLESPFVGPGMRGRGRLRYFPCRLSLVPALLASALPPDVVLVQTSVPSNGTRVARHRGEHPARGDRGRPGPRRAGDRAAQPAGSVHLR